MREIKCKHFWEMEHLVREPMEMETAEKEVAYLVCHKCGAVKKEDIKLKYN